MITDGTPNPNDDWVIKKFSSSGTEAWTRTIPFTGYSAPWSLAVDSSNDIYIVGYHEIADEQTNWIINKLNGGDGTVVTAGAGWDKTLNGGVGGMDEAMSVIVDGSDNVYVSGSMYLIAPEGGIPEETDITCEAESFGGGLGGKYFFINSKSNELYVWYNVDGGSTDPAPGGKSPIEVTINTGDSAIAVAAATATAISNNWAFSDTNATDEVVTVIHSAYGGGNVTDAADFDTGFTIFDVRIQGADSGNPDWIIKKFDSSGNLLWTEQFASGSDRVQGTTGAAFK